MAQKLYLDNPAWTKGFDAVKASLTGAEKAWLNDLRADAMAKFTATGIPGPKVEEWKYTPLGFLANENYAVAPKASQSTEIKALFDKAYSEKIAGPVVVFVNGHINPDLTSFPTQEGLVFDVFSENPQVFRESLTACNGATSLNNLNRAMVTDGYSLEIGENVDLDQPIQIIHIATSGTNMHSLRSRSRIVAGKGAKARIIETFIGVDGERYWTHMISDVDLAQDAELALFQFQLRANRPFI